MKTAAGGGPNGSAGFIRSPATPQEKARSRQCDRIKKEARVALPSQRGGRPLAEAEGLVGIIQGRTRSCPIPTLPSPLQGKDRARFGEGQPLVIVAIAQVRSPQSSARTGIILVEATAAPLARAAPLFQEPDRDADRRAERETPARALEARSVEHPGDRHEERRDDQRGREIVAQGGINRPLRPPAACRLPSPVRAGETASTGSWRPWASANRGSARPPRSL
jgi:hypothetical protein